MTEPVACREVTCVRPDGRTFTVKMTIGKPYADSNSARCPVALEPLHDRLPDITGVDSWQAVQLAMQLVEQLLRNEVNQGSKLYWPEEEGGVRYEYELDEPDEV